MIKNIALVLSGAALATLLILGTGQAPPKHYFVEAPEESADVEDHVTEPELEAYIDVYSAMQSDHSLTIDPVPARLTKCRIDPPTPPKCRQPAAHRQSRPNAGTGNAAPARC